MDYSKFTYVHLYKENRKLSFDFDIKKYNNHNRTTFEDYKSLLYFLENNPEKEIFLTLDQVDDFIEEDNKLIVNLTNYQSFCKKIGQNGQNRAHAFFARRVKSFSDEDKKQIISNSTIDEISERINSFSRKQQTDLLANLSYPIDKNDQKISLNEENVVEVLLQVTKDENKSIVIENLKKLEKDNFEGLQANLNFARLSNLTNSWSENISNCKESFWQSLFENNAWVLQQIFPFNAIMLQGETYVGGKSTKGRNGEGGVVTDFLYQNTSTLSIALIDIKTPCAKLVGKIYRGEKESNLPNESYSMHPDLSGGLVQVQNQLNTAIERFKDNIGTSFDEEKVNFLVPKAVLVIGNLSSLTLAEKKSFFLFRKTIADITIITFDELQEKILSLKKVFENEN